MTVEHEMWHWCWCRPRIINDVHTMTVVHRDVDPPHWLSDRRFAGGSEYEDSGGAAEWRHLIP
jgi:hypothetical protein